MRMGFNVRYKRYFIRRIAIIAAVVLLIYGTLYRLAPSYQARFSACANTMVNDIVNTSVSEVFAETDGGFSETDNGIIDADTVKINRLKSRLINDIQKRINTYGAQTVHIPLMSASKLPVLSGIGPQIPLKIAPDSLVFANLEENFESAGINQVNHRVTLKISVDVTGTGYMFSHKETVTTDIPLLETVIKGDVPKYYGANAGIISD